MVTIVLEARCDVCSDAQCAASLTGFLCARVPAPSVCVRWCVASESGGFLRSQGGCPRKRQAGVPGPQGLDCGSVSGDRQRLAQRWVRGSQPEHIKHTPVQRLPRYLALPCRRTAQQHPALNNQAFRGQIHPSYAVRRKTCTPAPVPSILPVSPSPCLSRPTLVFDALCL